MCSQNFFKKSQFCSEQRHTITCLAVLRYSNFVYNGCLQQKTFKRILGVLKVGRIVIAKDKTRDNPPIAYVVTTT